MGGAFLPTPAAESLHWHWVKSVTSGQQEESSALGLRVPHRAMPGDSQPPQQEPACGTGLEPTTEQCGVGTRPPVQPPASASHTSLVHLMGGRPRNRVSSGLWPGSAAMAVSSHWLPWPAPLAQPGAAACSWERLEMGCLGTLWLRRYAGLSSSCQRGWPAASALLIQCVSPTPRTPVPVRRPPRASFPEETDPRPSKFLQPPGPLSSCPGRPSP